MSRRVFLEGWLEKKAEWRFAWDRRFFVLDDCRLAYHVDEGAPEKKWGTLAYVAPRPNVDGHTFAVVLVEGDTWTLRASDAECYRRWTTCMLQALEMAQRHLGTTTPVSLPPPGPATMGNADAAADHAIVGESVTPQPPSPSSSAAVMQNPNDDSGTTALTRLPSADTATANRATTSGTVSSGDGDGINRGHGLPLVASVRKQSAWAGTWRPRVLELHSGLELAYRVVAGGPVRKLYNVLSVDQGSGARRETCLLFSTTIGDQFWVQFASVAECARWYAVVLAELQLRRSWQWQPLPGLTSNAIVVVAIGDEGKAYARLRVQHHCATIAPHYAQPGTEALYVYGGSTEWCRHTFQPGADAFVPQPVAERVMRTMRVLELAGQHNERVMVLDPYEVQEGVWVRPPPLCGATLCAHFAPTVTDGVPSPLLLLALLGGTSGTTRGTSQTELWCAFCPLPSAPAVAGSTCASRAPAPSEASKPCQAIAAPQPVGWQRYHLPAQELPALVYHDAICLPAPSRDAAAPEAVMLVTGGLDEKYCARAECFLVRWPLLDALRVAEGGNAVRRGADTGAAVGRCVPTVQSFPALPQPRAFHRMARLADGTVVLVGGRGVQNADVAQTVLTLSPSDYRDAVSTGAVGKSGPPATPPWLPVCYDAEDGLAAKQEMTVAGREERGAAGVGPLPALPDVAVASSGCDGRVFVLAQRTAPSCVVQLYVLDFDDMPSSTVLEHNGGRTMPTFRKRLRWREVGVRVGAAPCRTMGATMHLSGAYLYIIGSAADCGTSVTGSDEVADGNKKYCFQICTPLRMLVASS